MNLFMELILLWIAESKVVCSSCIDEGLRVKHLEPYEKGIAKQQTNMEFTVYIIEILCSCNLDS